MNSQASLLQRFKDIAAGIVEPLAQKTDEEARFPEEALAALARAGLMGLPYPKEAGGAGSTYREYIEGVEILARACASTAVCYATHVALACYPIWAFGTSEQKEAFLRPLLEGRNLGAFALTEREAGTDVGALHTTAVRARGGYVLNGGKIYITNAGRAHTYIVFARTGGPGPGGISAFLVSHQDKGLFLPPPQKKLGIRGAWTGELLLRDLILPENRRIGKENEGFAIAMKALSIGRIGIAAQATGIAQRALEESLHRLTRRKQFGSLLAEFQGLRWKAADMYTRIEASRQLTIHAAELLDKGCSIGTASSAAKLFASESAVQCTAEAMQIAGGEGYMSGSVVERLYRDAKITQIYEGTSEVQRIVIAKYLLT